MRRLLALALLPFAADADEPQFKRSLDLSVEGTAFFADPVDPAQDGSGVSVAAGAEFDYAWTPTTSVRFLPFARWDQHDDERTHADIRELALRHRHGGFDLVAGISRVFWGTVESVHLVDIVNQTNLVEDIDGEDKLGQPLLSIGYSGTFGRLEGFVLPYFRERRLPGVEGRLRAPLPYDRGDALYRSGAERRHIDTAIRYSLARGPLDLGVSHFSGTAREPGFVVTATPTGPLLTPYYDQIEQTGLDASYVVGGWLLKLEAIHQNNHVDPYSAAAGGFEYSFNGLFETGWDLGVLAEYLWDERQQQSPSPFQNDVFAGLRLAGNDIAGTEFLAGVAFDCDHASHFASVEASRRLGAAGKLSLELRVFGSDQANDPLHALRRDDYLRIEYMHYF